MNFIHRYFWRIYDDKMWEWSTSSPWCFGTFFSPVWLGSLGMDARIDSCGSSQSAPYRIVCLFYKGHPNFYFAMFKRFKSFLNKNHRVNSRIWYLGRFQGICVPYLDQLHNETENSPRISKTQKTVVGSASYLAKPCQTCVFLPVDVLPGMGILEDESSGHFSGKDGKNENSAYFQGFQCHFLDEHFAFGFVQAAAKATLREGSSS